jgi:hypothetical protein
MSENKYTLDDLVDSTLESKPLDFEIAFNDIIKDRISDAIELRKQEIAKNIFNKQEEGTDDGEES